MTFLMRSVHRTSFQMKLFLVTSFHQTSFHVYSREITKSTLLCFSLIRASVTRSSRVRHASAREMRISMKSDLCPKRKQRWRRVTSRGVTCFGFVGAMEKMSSLVSHEFVCVFNFSLIPLNTGIKRLSTKYGNSFLSSSLNISGFDGLGGFNLGLNL
jgi:hypothetical protein